MTPDELHICTCLGKVKTTVSGFDKRFMRDISSLTIDKELSEKQKEWMYRLLYKYRKQLPQTYERHKGHEHCRNKAKRQK